MNKTIFRLMFFLFCCGGTDKMRVETPDDEFEDIEREEVLSTKETLRAAIDAENEGNRAQAAKLYRRALKQEGDNPVANYRYVHFLLDQGDGKEALRVAEDYTNVAPNDPEGLHTYVDALIATGYRKEARSLLDELLEEDPNDAAAMEKRGLLYMSLKDKRALSDLAKLTQESPKDTELRNKYALALSRFGKQQAAMRQIKKSMNIDNKEADTWITKGIIERSSRKFKVAQRSHRRAVALQPKSAKAHFELGVTLNAKGANTGAEEHIGLAVDLDPKNPTYWYAYGDILRLTKHNDDAIVAYERCLELDDDNVKAWLRYAKTLMKVNRRDDAEDAVQAILELDPDNGEGLALQKRLDR